PRLGGHARRGPRAVPRLPHRGRALDGRPLRLLRERDRLICAVASARMSVADDRAELERLEDEWMASMQARDMDRLEELVADGFRFMAIHLYPEPMTRQQWMDAAREGYTIVSYAYERMEVDVFGDTGVIHARYSQVANF